VRSAAGSVARVCRLTPLCSRTTLCLLSLLHHRGRWVSSVLDGVIFLAVGERGDGAHRGRALGRAQIHATASSLHAGAAALACGGIVVHGEVDLLDPPFSRGSLTFKLTHSHSLNSLPLASPTSHGCTPSRCFFFFPRFPQTRRKKPAGQARLLPINPQHALP
jgi:hypothetical protein